MSTSKALDYTKLDIKRFYLPGLVIPMNCPNCTQAFNLDMETHYPYDIKVDGTCTLSFLCPHCEHEINQTAQLTINLTLK